MNVRRRGACPGSEDIAAFVVGGLKGSTPAEVVAHVADCVACRALLAALARAGGETEEPAGPPARRARRSLVHRRGRP